MTLLLSVLFLTVCAAEICSAAEVDEDTLHLLKMNPNAFSHESTKFVVGFFGNFIRSEFDSSVTRAALYIATSDPRGAKVDIEIPQDINPKKFTGFPRRDVTIQPGTATRIDFPVSGNTQPDIRVNSLSETKKGIVIESKDNVPITVIGLNDHPRSVDSFLALPCHKYSEEGATASDYKYFIFSTGKATSEGTPFSGLSQFLYIACEDNTQIDITLSDGSTLSAQRSKYTTHIVQRSFDLTGSIIDSNGPLAVFTGQQCGQIPSNETACDVLVEQIPPHITYGQTFFALPIPLRQSGEIYRIGSFHDDNRVTVTCTTMSGETFNRVVEDKGKRYFEFYTNKASGNVVNHQREFCCIETTRPSTVMQYALGHSVDSIGGNDQAIPDKAGDPAISYVPPITQYRNNLIMTTSSDVRPTFLTYISYAISSEFFDPMKDDAQNFVVNGVVFEPDEVNTQGTGGTGGYIPIRCNKTICGYGAYSDIAGQDNVINYNSSREPNAAVFASINGIGAQLAFSYPAGFEMEPIGLPHVSILDAVVYEDEGEVKINVTRTGGDLSLRTTIFASTRDATALFDEDYVTVSDKRFKFNVNSVNPRPKDGDFIIDIINDDIAEATETFEITFIIRSNPDSSGYAYPSNMATVTILDDDGPVECSINQTTYTVEENNEFVDIIIATKNPRKVGTSCVLSTVSETGRGKALAGLDYTAISSVAAVFERSAFTTIRIPIINDDRAEVTESFSVMLTSTSSAVSITQPDAVVQITDSDVSGSVVRVNFDPTIYNVSEGDSTTLMLVLSESSSQNVSVQVSTQDGTALAPGDYTSITNTITFPAGTTRREVTVQTVGDSIHERAESFTAILSNPVGGELGTDTTATVNIADNDNLIVNFNPTTYSVTEGDQAELMVVLNRPSDHDVTVQLTTSDGRATAPGDYTSTTTTITFPAGSTMQTVSVPTVNDDTNEQLEEFSAQLSNPSVGLMLGSNISAQIDIEDNDPLSVQFEPATYSVQEGRRANLVAVLNREADRSVSVSFNTQDGTAEAPGDYSSISGRILEFPAGDTSVMIPVDTAQDVIAEGDEGFEAILSNPTNGLELGSQDRADVTIRDDDVLSINFDPIVYNITEGMSATLRLVLSTTSTEDVTVNLTTVDGSATAPGDYTPNILTVTFPAGSTTQEVLVQTVEDFIHERAESFTAILSNPVGGELGTDTTATVIIADNDDLIVDFNPTTYSVTEGDQAELMVVLNRPSDHDVTIQLTTSDGRATAPGDYTSTTTTITFPAGSTMQTVSVPTVNDDTNEQLEEFSAQLSNPSDELVLGTDSSAQVNIEDNDPLSVQFEPATYSVQEGGGTNLVAVLNREADRNVSVGLNTQDGTAEAPGDYSSISGRILEFPAGVTSVMIPVDTAQDVIAEGDEGFEAILSNPTNGLELGSQDRADITIRDDDVLSVSFGRTLYPVSEGDVALLEVILSTPSTENVSVDIVTMDSSAEAPGDYVRFVTTIEFTAGTTQLELPVPTFEDEVNELGEIFFANLSNPRGGGAMLGRDVDATIEIIDDDPLSISFVPTTYTTDEGEDAVLMIALNRVADRPISVDVSTSENTATDPDDYNGVSTTVTFPPGETLVEFPVSTVDDIISELSEDFEATLSNPSPGAMLGNRTALISIADNDDLTVSIEESDYRVPEGAGIVEVCVVLNYEAVEEIRVFGRSKEAVAGEAKDVEDFTAEMFPITFQPGERKKCVSVNITNDEIVEQTEESFVFDIEVQSSHLNPTASRSSSNITIIDDDMLSIRFEEENYIVNETAGTVTVCVERVGRTADPIMVTINAAESSPSDASDGDDFRAGSFEVTIQPDEMKGCVNIPILDDNLAMEGTERFDLTLDAPDGIPSSPPRTSRVSVLDDDVINVSFTTPDVMVQENVSSGSTEVCFMPSTSSAQPYTIEVSHMPTGQFPATFGVDYTVVREDLAIMIPSGSPRERCIPIGIVNDSIALEEPETFIFEFETLPSGVVRGGNPTALVNITEDDVSVMVNFVSEDVEVNENNGSVFVCVERNAVTYVEQTVPIIISVGTADTNDFVKKDTNITFGQLRSMACTEIPVLDDTTQEFPETFAVGFGRVPPGGGIVPGPFSQASITIIDDDDPESSDCRISEPLMVRPFNSSASYNFRGTCELIAVMSCNAIEPSFSVRVDFIGETDSLGNVGIFKDGFAWISGPNGRLTDNAQKIANEDSLGFFYPENDIHFIPNNTEGINQFIIGDSIGVTVIHDYEAGEVSINYMSGSSLQESCGICGTQSGRLRQLDGSTVTSPAQRQGFVESYRPAPDRQYLPQRTECGIVRNDSVIGDPLFTVPVRTENGERRTLCFEVHGESNRTFNLISDTCLNVNAHYSRVDDLNIISSVGIKAEGYNGTCMDIQVNLEGCAVSTSVGGGPTIHLDPSDDLQMDHISLRQYADRVRISVPNCHRAGVVMWVICERANDRRPVDMIRFHVSRGVNLMPSSHGLLGQFWNVPVSVEKYTSEEDLSDLTDNPSNLYNITVIPADIHRSSARFFLADIFPRTWDNTKEPCLYVGNAQAGPGGEVPDLVDSVIEGKYTHYMVASLFETEFMYEQWKSDCRAPPTSPDSALNYRG